MVQIHVRAPILFVLPTDKPTPGEVLAVHGHQPWIAIVWHASVADLERRCFRKAAHVGANPTGSSILWKIQPRMDTNEHESECAPKTGAGFYSCELVSIRGLSEFSTIRIVV